MPQASSVVKRYRQQLQSNPSQLIGAYTIRQLAALQHAWLELGQPSQLRVLDFGGALGTHFHAIEPNWPWCRLLWTVCETTAVARAGTAEFESARPNGTTLSFTDQPAEVLNAGIDVVLASCSLQYPEHWQLMLQLFPSRSLALAGPSSSNRPPQRSHYNSGCTSAVYRHALPRLEVGSLHLASAYSRPVSSLCSSGWCRKIVGPFLISIQASCAGARSTTMGFCSAPPPP